MIGSTVFSLGFESVINRISTKLGIAINNDIQADIFDKIVDADWLEISKYANGDVLNRFNGDIGTVSGNAISWLPTIIIAVYRFIATFFVILHYDWVMALIAFKRTVPASDVAVYDPPSAGIQQRSTRDEQ